MVFLFVFKQKRTNKLSPCIKEVEIHTGIQYKHIDEEKEEEEEMLMMMINENVTREKRNRLICACMLFEPKQINEEM